MTNVRFAQEADMPAVCDIVNHYIATTRLNFRTEPQTPEEWTESWKKTRTRYPWLVATEDERVVGVAYAGTWNARSAYDWSVESTVYVDRSGHRRGIGKALYERLFSLLDAQGFRTVVALIALPNPPSVAIHELFGFRPVGVLRSVGFKHGAWCDVGLWQRVTSTDAPPSPLRPVPSV